MNSAIQNLQGFPYERKFGMSFLPAPVRFLDTRAGQPAGSACNMPGAQLIADTDTLFQVRSKCTGVPSGAQGIFGIVYVLNHAVSGWITCYANTSQSLRVNWAAQPYVQNRPYISTLYYNTAVPITNSYCAFNIGKDGKFWVYTSQTIDMLIDINGYVI